MISVGIVPRLRMREVDEPIRIRQKRHTCTTHGKVVPPQEPKLIAPFINQILTCTALVASAVGTACFKTLYYPTDAQIYNS